VWSFSRNDVHVWLAFVTESDKIFEMDLSMMQFGIASPHPFILPLDPANPLALNGICIGESIEMDSFEGAIEGLVEVQAASLLQMDPNTTCDVAGLHKVFNHIHWEALRNAKVRLSGYPNYFWHLLEVADGTD